jgi:hypothetical protein
MVCGGGINGRANTAGFIQPPVPLQAGRPLRDGTSLKSAHGLGVAGRMRGVPADEDRSVDVF